MNTDERPELDAAAKLADKEALTAFVADLLQGQEAEPIRSIPITAACRIRMVMIAGYS